MGFQTQFTNFLQDIEPSATTKGYAKSGHEALRDYIEKHESYQNYHVRSFLTGSYKRNTAIRPKSSADEIERPDVDIIVVTNHTLSDSPKVAVKLLYDCIKEKYSDIRPQTRSVGITTKTVDIDVVPLIAPYGMESTLYIPDRKQEKWLITNPPDHTAWTTKVNGECDGRFKPLVKLMKWWRRENPTIAKKPKGFMIECITAECMDYDETQYGELIVGTLENIVLKYAPWINAKLVPHVDDPGVPGNNVLASVTFDAFEGFYNKVKTHADVGRKALGETESEKALELWRVIFGGRFPARKSVTKTESLLSSAATPSGLTFPNSAITPKKPAGFA